MNTITVAELARRIESGAKPRLLDVRSAAEFSQLHARGAWLLPLEELSAAGIPGELVASEEPLYVLCRAGSRAGVACEVLGRLGVKNPVRVDGGTLAWEKAGLPVITGSSGVMSIERQVRIGAGAFVLVGVVLGWLFHPALAGLSAFVGAGLVFAGITDFCGMGILLGKMPWNRRAMACAPGVGTSVAQ